MSIREVTYYQAVCDWPGCTRTPHEEYSAWDCSDGVEEDVRNADWLEGRDGETHYCLAHPVAWASDHAIGEPFPEPPYLLIHDGDTDDASDDGKASLIGGAA